MQQRLQWDFGGVRVHTGSAAAAAARGMRARAFTVGQDIGFADGRFAPGTPEGAFLLAHELAHVVQQDRGGPAPGANPALERDAGRAATRALAGGSAPVGGASGVGVARQDEAEPVLPRRVLPPHVPAAPKLRLNPVVPLAAPRRTPPADVVPPPLQREPYLKLVMPAFPPPAKSAGDPQTGTGTGGLIPGNAQVQDPGDFGLTYNLSHPVYGPGGFGPGFGFAAGIASLGHDVGLELGATGGAPGGTSTSATFVPHLAWAPKDKHLNIGAFGNFGVTGGTSPPGYGDGNVQAGGTAIVEAPIGGDRDRPVVLPSLQFSGAYGRFVPVGDGFAFHAGTAGVAANLQYNPNYYTASDGTKSKTPTDTLFLEGARNYAQGGLYGGPKGATAGSVSNAVNVGYQHNFRLNDGHLIVSPNVWLGAKQESDRLGTQTSSQWSGAAGIGLGISLSPADKKPDD